MGLYCGIDLHSTNSYIVVSDDSDRLVLEKRFSNDLRSILCGLEPYRDNLQGVAVESTFNWYWLVDGLMDGVATGSTSETARCRRRSLPGLRRGWLGSLVCVLIEFGLGNEVAQLASPPRWRPILAVRQFELRPRSRRTE